jgi:hypothetical protein
MVREEGDDKRMAYDYYRRVLCPLCEGGEMRAVNAALAHCSRCDETMSHGFFDDLLLIRALPEADDSEAFGRGTTHRGRSGSD